MGGGKDSGQCAIGHRSDTLWASARAIFGTFQRGNIPLFFGLPHLPVIPLWASMRLIKALIRSGLVVRKLRLISLSSASRVKKACRMTNATPKKDEARPFFTAPAAPAMLF